MARIWLVALFLAVFTSCGGMVGGFSIGNGKDTRTPLEKVVQEASLPEVKRLLSSGADPNGGRRSGSPLIYAALRPSNVEMIRTLVAAGANPNGLPSEGKSCWTAPLVLAAGDLENTRALLDAGASVQGTSCSKPVLGYLRVPIIELLVQRGFDLNTVDKDGRNQLHIALASRGVPPIDGIEYLIRAGVPINARDRFGKTPLDYWREPREYERHWFSTWLLELLDHDSHFREQRENRTKISVLLERAHAVLSSE